MKYPITKNNTVLLHLNKNYCGDMLFPTGPQQKEGE